MIFVEKLINHKGNRQALQKYTVGARFERIGIDIAGPYPETARKNSYILVISDYFSKLVEIFPLANIQAETVADVLFRGWIKRYGCPREIHSDHGRQFESAVFLEMCKFLEISKTRTTPFHPRSDEMVERMNRTIQNMLSKYIQENQKDWDLHLDFIVMAYNSCEHDSTGCSPYKIVYGENIVLPVDILTDNVCAKDTNETEEKVNGFMPKLQSNVKKIHAFVRKSLSKSAKKQKKHYDAHVKEMKYEVGDLVWRNQKKTLPGVKTKITRHWTGPWMITEKLCDVLFRIKHSDSSSSVIIHGDNLKKYYGPKTITLRADRHVHNIVEQPNLQAFEYLDSQENVSYSSEHFVEANDVIKDGGAACAVFGANETCILLAEQNQDVDPCAMFGTKEAHILLKEAVQPNEMLQWSYGEETVCEKPFKNEMNGCENSPQTNPATVILSSCKQTGYNVSVLR